MTILTSRRALVTSLAGLLAAPAIVRASSLMPVVPLRRSTFLRGIATLSIDGVRYEGSVVRWNFTIAGEEFFGPEYNLPAPMLAVRSKT